MKRFAWVQVAVQALGIDGKGGHDVPGKGKRRNEVYIKGIDEPIPTPIWEENARAKSEADLANAARVAQAVWNEPALSREPPAIHRMASSEELEGRATIRSVTDPLAKKRRSLMRPRETKEKEGEIPLREKYNPAIVPYVSDGYVQKPRTLKRRNESTSTIFKNSPLAPVTIIVTTPEEDLESRSSSSSEPRNSFNSIRAFRNTSPDASTTSLPGTQFSPSFSTESLPLPQHRRLDPSRLMPPTEHQIDTRRLRKAQEFREIRKFLIHFMNAKGDQFPKKLRSKMMDAYAITDSDLSPEVVARFNDLGNEVRDEGVALEQLGMNELDKETTDAEDLQILSMAFQSRIPMVTPTRRESRVGNTPPYMNKSSIRPVSTSISKPAPPLVIPGKAALPKPPTPPRSKPPVPPKPARKAEDEPLNWLGPLISTSPNSEWKLPLVDDSDPKTRLQKAQSQPNMSHRPSGNGPPVPGIPGHMQSGRGRNNSLSGNDGMGKAIHVARVKRQGIISGAFGAVREAMGGKKVGVGGEKRRMMREGR